jgi:hypothetical protein
MSDTQPPERASYAALWQALQDMADGFDQQHSLLLRSELVMSTLRRAAAALERAEADQAAALATERERCAKLCDELERSIWDEYKKGHRSSGHTEGRSDGAAECAALIRAKAAT